MAGGEASLAARLRQQRVALGCHKRRAPLGGCPFVVGAMFLGLIAGAGAVQVARAVAELGEVSGPPLRPVYRGWGVTLVALGRATDGPHHASTALIPFAIPRAGFRPPQALGHEESL